MQVNRANFIIVMLNYLLAVIYLLVYSTWKIEMGYRFPIDVQMHKIAILSLVGGLILKLLRTSRIKDFMNKQPKLSIAIIAPLIVIVSMTAFTLTDLFVKDF